MTESRLHRVQAVQSPDGTNFGSCKNVKLHTCKGESILNAASPRVVKMLLR